MTKFIIDKQSVTPLYKQLVDQIELSILNNIIQKNYKLPSVNKICIEHKISRDSVLLAYSILKKKGIINAIGGKGYYVKTNAINYQKRYFLLFDELNTFKEDIYNAFIEPLNGKAIVEIYFHHFNVEMFKKLVNDANGNYSKYIIMPSNLKDIEDVVHSLPPADVYILDQTRKTLSSYSTIYQNFTDAIYNALFSVKLKLRRYSRIILVFTNKKEPLGMIEGFNKFCSTHNFEHKIIYKYEDYYLEKSTVYLTPGDNDLVSILESSKKMGYRIGKDVGIISYNDTPLKKVVADGITTISTDFKEMGSQLASMVWHEQKHKIENPSRIILRKSL
jgi:DNA-binding transcriptional regulator YhcF (GntR family)